MPPLESETTLRAGERPQTHLLDRAATGTGMLATKDNKMTAVNNRKGCVWMGTAVSTFTVRSTAALFKLWQLLLIITSVSAGSSLYDAALGQR
jgi:hypothetical protein